MKHEVNMSRLLRPVIFFTIWLLGVLLTSSHADRLIRRSDGEIFLLGLGTPDAKKETVLFKNCKDRDSKIFSLKEYLFQSGKDCGSPKIFSVLESIRIDGTGEPNKVVACSTGKTCLRYTVKSSEEVDNVFTGAKIGDKIEVTISNFDNTKMSAGTQNGNLTVRFVSDKTGEVKDSLSFSKIPASGDFVNKVAGKMTDLPK